MVVAFYFRLHLAYFPRPVVAIFARPEHCESDELSEKNPLNQILKTTVMFLLRHAGYLKRTKAI